MMRHEHMVACCQWQTQFDDREHAVALQNALSQWSNQALPGILSQSFERYCPAAQIWQIERLELDLGTLSLQDLDRQLPQRVRDALEDALIQLFRRHRSGSYMDSGQSLRIVDLHVSTLAQLRWFLLHGTSPWWTPRLSHPMTMVEQLFEQQPQAVADLLRQVGASAAVRRRIVWQWGEPRIRVTIQLLEPWHSEFILRYADHLALSEQQQPSGGMHSRTLKSNIWYWILTHLLVERGTLFNTLQFVRSTLFQMAQHEQLDFSTLLHRLSDIARQMLSQGLMAPQFLQVLGMLEQQQQRPANAVVVTEPDLWQRLQQMLHSRERLYQQAIRPVYFNELFVRLAGQDASRTARIIREAGRREEVRLFLLQQLSHEQLYTLVAIIAPGDQLFIQTHVRHTQTMLRAQRLDPLLIWRILLDYLLASSGSYFNRRQLVHTTLVGLSRQYHLDYVLLLTMLVKTSVQWQLAPHHFELLAILQELQRAALNQQSAAAWFRVQADDATGLDIDPIRRLIVILHLRPETCHQHFQYLFRQQQWQARPAKALSQFWVHSLAARGHLSLSELRALLVTLSPQAGASAFLLLAMLQRWQTQGGLPRIPAADPMHWLATLMVQALFNPLTYPTPISRWQDRFFSALQRETGQDFQVWHEALAHLCAAVASVSVCAEMVAAAARWRPEVFTLSDGTVPLSQISSSEQIWTVLQQHPDAVGYLMKFARTSAGQQALAPLLPTALQRSADWQQWLRKLADSVAGIGGSYPSDLKESLARSCWAIWLKELRAYRHLHHRVRGFRLKVSGWVAASLQHWAQRHNVRWSVLASRLRLQQSVDSSGVLDWVAILAQLNPVHHDAEFVAPPLPMIHPTVAATSVLLPLSPAPTGESIDSTHQPDDISAWYQDQRGQYLQQPQWRARVLQWLKSGQNPSQTHDRPPVDWQQALLDWLYFYPDSFRQQIMPLMRISIVYHRLLIHLSLASLLDVMARSPLSLQAEIETIQILERLVLQLNLPQMSFAERQQHLLSCVVENWLRQHWQNLTPDALVAALFGKILQVGTVLPALLVQQLSRPGLVTTHTLAPSIQTFIRILQRATARQTISSEAISASSCAPNEREISIDTLRPDSRNEIGRWGLADDPHQASCHTVPMALFNAGLVLLQSFIPAFFERLQLTQDNQFVTFAMQRRAVHCLQFLATGAQETAEPYLLLNKVLCGLPSSEPVETSVSLSTEETDIVHSLIEAVIDYWPAIGKTSIDGFRGNWLVRNGTLTESQDHWDLIVEKRPYDMLIARAPLSYSIIRLPWMKKPIYVTWPT
ncbi:contractile injection system tape measure protein [Vibrio spartinae]|uniref:Uncharacterized protein n=1 Tax=Vibrio spartinae TaxID=1918945 RepID=A0A1N6M9S2_9VIBR|nr:contractile injection system tape measure protein [Vibrio spartinae]SIO96202.1 hypothetical protein VSP9026_03984 [Vibrio spartinae]